MDFYAPIGLPPRQAGGYPISPLIAADLTDRARATFSLDGWGTTTTAARDQAADGHAVWSLLAGGLTGGARSRAAAADLVTAAVLLGAAGDARGDHKLPTEEDAARDTLVDVAPQFADSSDWPTGQADEAPFGF